MPLLLTWIVLFCVTTVISVTLIGSRSLISGDLSLQKIIEIILDWRFIVGGLSAFASRMFFVFINNALLKIPELAQNSTTITLFVTSVAIIFVVIANYYFLDEKINVTQGIGAFIVLFGIFVIMRH